MKTAAQGISSDECYKCGELDHRCNNCPKRQRRQQQQLYKQKTQMEEEGRPARVLLVIPA